MSKVGIVAYILGFIFIGFCFWFVGCSSDSTNNAKICGDNTFYGDDKTDTTGTEFIVKDDCGEGEWLY